MSSNIVKLSFIRVELIYTLIGNVTECLFPRTLTIRRHGQLLDYF